jgi:hypothetical protein
MLAPMALEVVPVSSKRDREDFLRLPWSLYENDPAWIPNLLMLQREQIDPKKNPFFEYGEAQLFLARRDGRPAGRISAQVNHEHNRFHKDRTGFFGFFECEEDEVTARVLFTAAEAWLRERDLDKALGPLNFSLNEEAGMLVEGFEQPPMVATTHALPYYGRIVEASGYAKEVDLLAYRWDIADPPARMMEAVDKTRQAVGLSVRKASLRHFGRDVSILLDIYNDAWQDNWGYVPVTPREAKKLASDLRLIVDTNVAIIAEVDGEPAGMIVGLPNLYEAIRDFHGFVNPWNVMKLLWRLKLRGVETGRVFLFGVKQKFQRRRDLAGLPFLLLYELYAGSQKGRYRWTEESWILDTNKRMNAIMPYWGAFVYKRYRLYSKLFEPA